MLSVLMLNISLLFFCLLQKAEAELAYELQAAKIKQLIRTEEIEIEVVERKKQIAVEDKEIMRKEKELIATIKRPAEAEAYRVETIAQGKRYEKQVLLHQERVSDVRYTWLPLKSHIKIKDFLRTFSR